MHAPNIPEGQIGSNNLTCGVPWRTFFADERDGGGNGLLGRLNIDSGVLRTADSITSRFSVRIEYNRSKEHHAPLDARP